MQNFLDVLCKLNISNLATSFILKKAIANVPSETIGELRRAKEFSDISDWKTKHAIILSLMQKAPQDWYIDSTEEDPYVSGITHRSGWRYHLPKYLIPKNIRVKENARSEGNS